MVVVETFIPTFLARLGCRVAAVVVADQRVPSGIAINHRAKLINDVQERFFTPRPFRLVSVSRSWHEVGLDLLISDPCCFVCSECHVALRK